MSNAAKVSRECSVLKAACGTNKGLDTSAVSTAETLYDGAFSNQPVFKALAQSLRLFSVARSQACRVS